MNSVKETLNRLKTIEEIINRSNLTEDILPNQLEGRLSLDQKKFILNAKADIQFLIDIVKPKKSKEKFYDLIHNVILYQHEVSLSVKACEEFSHKIPNRIFDVGIKYGFDSIKTQQEFIDYFEDHKTEIAEFIRKIQS